MSEVRNAKVQSIVREMLPQGAKILEISCSEGLNLKALQEAGYDMRGTNFTHYPEAPKDIPIDEGVDLLKGLPYEDGTFDAVLLLDVIEHVSDHGKAINEVSRVLKTGGLSIIAAPNSMSLNSRFRFLFTGFLKVKRSFIGFDIPPDKSFAFHNHPPYFPVFIYQLVSHGLEPIKLDAVVYKLKNILLWLLMIPFVYPATWAKTHGGERHIKNTPAAGLLFKKLVSFPTLCGEVFVMVSRKHEPGEKAQPGSTWMPDWYHGDGVQKATNEQSA